MKYVSKTAHKNIDLWIIREGWILVTRSGTVGRVAVTSPMWNGWAASEHILRIVPDPKSDCPPGYICAFLSSELGQAQLTSQIYGAVVDEITEDQARSVLIPVPTTDAQRAAVKKIDALAMESMRAKDEAVRAAQNSVSEITSLLSHQAGQAPGASEAAAQENRKRIATVSPDRLSMHPVDAKDALRAFMQVDPKKVKAAEAKTRADKPTRR
jgi:hypothetical protein